MSMAIIYESGFGRSAAVVAKLVAAAEAHGHCPEVFRAGSAARMDLSKYTGFVLVAPVYFGRHFRAMRRFVHTWARPLEARPCAIVTLGPDADHERIRRTLLARTAIRPEVLVSSADHEELAAEIARFFASVMTEVWPNAA